MALIKSISGTRGTIGGRAGDNLTPIDIVAAAAAYGQWLKKSSPKPKVVIGRDARISGELVQTLVMQTLVAQGINVIDLGLSTTPTVEVMVTHLAAQGGIVITASHNPKQWNALKFLNEKGEFISAAEGEMLLKLTGKKVSFADVDEFGTISPHDTAIDEHIAMVLALPLVNVEAVRAKKYKVVVDPVNSSGAIAVPPLLRALGCDVVLIHGETTGDFAHNPEPLPEHLTDLSKAVVSERAQLGIAVDPDVDRLAFVTDRGEMFGEEYTLVTVADYVLSKQKGPTVSNLSSTRALRDVTELSDCQYFASAVGEVNVVEKMKEVGAVIGGEGNGGIIYPPLHYGRDALVGIALFLSQLAEYGKSVTMLRNTFPDYYISKNKIELSPEIDLNAIMQYLQDKYSRSATINTIDGLKIEFDRDWIHLRKSNTEPIIRVYAESVSSVIAENLISKIMSDIRDHLHKR